MTLMKSVCVCVLLQDQEVGIFLCNDVLFKNDLEEALPILFEHTILLLFIKGPLLFFRSCETWKKNLLLFNVKVAKKIVSFFKHAQNPGKCWGSLRASLALR